MPAPSRPASGAAAPGLAGGGRRRRGTVAAALAALAAAGFAAAPGAAGDRSITGSVSQSFIADSNVQLEEGSDASLGSITSLSLGYVDRTPSATLSLGTSFNYSAFTGEDNDNISGLFPRLNGSYSVRRPTQSLGFSFGASITPVDFFENTFVDLPGAPLPPVEPPDPIDDDDDLVDDDPGDVDAPGEDPVEAPTGEPLETGDGSIAEREALRVEMSLGGNWSRTISSVESISFGASAGRTDFIDGGPSLVPNTRFGVNGGWNRRIAADASAGVSTGASLFLSEGDENRRTVTLRIGPSASWNRTARERLSITLGPSFNHSTFDRELAGGGTVSETETDVSVAGNLAFSFSGDVDSLSAALSQSVTPEDDGAIVNTTSLRFGWGRRISQAARLNWSASAAYRTAAFGGGGDDDDGFDDRIDYRTSLGWSYRINPRNGANLSVFAARDDDGGGSEEIVTGVGAGWSYVIAPRTNANLGYDLRYETEDELVSHRLGLTLSHGFTLLP